MSGRKLGGGRILGSGKGLAPTAHPALSFQVDSHHFGTSEASPSPNNSSLGSSPAPGLPPTSPHDLISKISLEEPSESSRSEQSALLCPICNEEMLTLLQLNRHLDDAHQELPEIQQDAVKTWFDKQVLKAKKFQPLSLINQTLRGIDTFESNESTPAPAVLGPRAPEVVLDPDELITRSHWQKPTPFDVCTDPTCGRRLGPINGNVNCRKCGRLFCEEHTMYQMKLSRSAAHEPVRGYWARVCETCYKSRDGYNDHSGVINDHTSAFRSIRERKVERQNLEMSRLEKRLTRLTQLWAAHPGEATQTGGTSLLSPVASLSGQKNARRALEQTIVTWEDDATVSRCPFCQQEFGSWSFRRHHCRICGRVVCADPRTACSTDVALTVASQAASNGSLPHLPSRPQPPKAGGEKSLVASGPEHINVDVRMCRECQHTIFSARDFASSIAHVPADQRAYETLRQFERGIKQLMPSFQRALQALQVGDSGGVPPTQTQIKEASKIRKRLLDAFAKYESVARRIRDMKSDSDAQLRIQQAIYAQSSSFLHTYMLTLKSVPQILRGRSNQPSRLTALSSTNSSPANVSALRHRDLMESETASQVSEVSTVVSTLEIEEKELRERLVVLEEQRFMVRDMLGNARGSRRFEEVSALSRNIEELDQEIQHLHLQIGDVEERYRVHYTE